MRAIAVDDERLALESLRQKLSHVGRIREVHAFPDPEEALAFFAEQGAELAFLDISMATMDGLTLANRLRELRPNVIIIFVTGYSEYALDALKLHADGYLMKPMDEEDIERELDALEQLRRRPRAARRIRAQCFGNFELFIDGTPVSFSRSRAKELLAYLVDRQGASCNTAELCAVLFEDEGCTRASRSHFRTLVSDLSETLHARGAGELLVKQRNSFAVNTELFDCDMYGFLHGDNAAIGAYTGEYMAQYSWAEMRLGQLED